MIEIYEEKVLTILTQHVGIGTNKYKQNGKPKPGFIVDPCPPKDKIDVPNPIDTHPNGTIL